MPMELTEFLIAFSIIMMMLSLISERAANFAKIHFQGKRISIPYIYFNSEKQLKFFLSTELKILAYEQPTAAMEKEREYRIQIINIIIGIIIAAFANADFFEITEQIRNSKQAVAITGWDVNKFQLKHLFGFLYLLTFLWSTSLLMFNRLQESQDKVNQKYVRFPFIAWIILTFTLIVFSNPSNNFAAIVTNTIGYIFTGLFLSLGSKFWHDLLDILFKFKNTKQVLSDPKTYQNYDSADKLQALADTSQYAVAEQLYMAYVHEIAAIKGVVSHGLNTITDPRTGLFKKIIEVEFTTSDAQQELFALQNKGSVVINYNTFYLRDYLILLMTEKLEALLGDLTDKPPVCYAYNANSPNTVGSFWVYEKENQYYAVSNLHVFADASEFKNFENNTDYQLTHKSVCFVIGGKVHPDKGVITDDYSFGNNNGYGVDVCICTISKAVFDTYRSTVNNNYLWNGSEDRMRMFGAISKYKEFYNKQQYTQCSINYKGFNNSVSMNVIKLQVTDAVNVQLGDSGSVIYFRNKKDNAQTEYSTGILIARSSNYAYMFRYYV